MHQNKLGKDLFILTNKLKRLLDKKHQQNQMHSGQARVLTYLYKHKVEVIYQKDIEQVFQIRGGSVTGLIDTLEKNELIQRVDSTLDKRKKMIILTSEGEIAAQKAIETTQKVEMSLSKVLTLREKEVFNKIYIKINEWIDLEEQDEKTI